MLKKKPFIIVLCLLFISGLVYIIFSVFEQKKEVYNQSKEVATKTKGGKLAPQLENALNILKENNVKALELAESSLQQSQKAKNKSLQMQSFYVLGRILSRTENINQSQLYYNEALLFSEKIKDDWYRGEILYRKAKNYYLLNDSKLALETFNDALYYCQLSNNYRTLGTTYSMIGTIFRVNGVYSKTIEYLIKARLNYNKADFSEGDAWVTYLLGQVYSDLRNSEKAMQYFLEALDKYQVLYSIDGVDDGVAICYEQIAIINLELDNFEEAGKNINLLLKIHTKNNSKFGISNVYSLLGKLEFLEGNYKEAQAHLNKSLKIKNSYLSLHGKSSIYLYQGLCLIKTGNLDGGIKKIEQGLEIALSNKSKKHQIEIYAKLSDIYLNSNNFYKAIYYKNKQIEVQDLILFDEAEIKVEQLQAFYEIDEKNRQLNELKKENELNILKIKQQRFYQIFMICLILFVLLIAVIITFFYNKLRHKNKELKILNTTTNKLFSIIAHDLRSPFNTILGFSDLLSSNAKNLETTKIVKFSEHINSAASNTLALLDNLLNWAKSQTGKITFKPKNLNVRLLIAQTIEVLNPSAKFKSITLSCVQASNIEVYADEYMLKTILRNLISNAIKFTNSNGIITVNALQNDKFIEISVSDNGVGMSNETRCKLFTSNANSTTIGTANEKGSGLGLLLCKELIEKHGGTIWVTSELNKGTTFYFSLPNKVVN